MLGEESALTFGEIEEGLLIEAISSSKKEYELFALFSRDLSTDTELSDNTREVFSVLG